MATEDEWTTVTKNSKRCAGATKRGRKNKNNAVSHHTSSKKLTLDEMEKLFQNYCQCLQKSNFWINLQEPLPRNIKRIVCYGVGNFDAGKAPMWQLALAQVLREFLEVEQVAYFDPCMTNPEAMFLERHSISVIRENERGKRDISETTTLFFMPHCPLKLYANVLSENWSNLPEVILFGNNLSAYTFQLQKSKSGILTLQTLQPYWTSFNFSISKQDLAEMPAYFEHALNDSSLTLFQEPKDMNWPERPVENEDDVGGETI
jgi:hypothetical protein